MNVNGVPRVCECGVNVARMSSRVWLCIVSHGCGGGGAAAGCGLGPGSAPCPYHSRGGALCTAGPQPTNTQAPSVVKCFAFLM